MEGLLCFYAFAQRNQKGTLLDMQQKTSLWIAGAIVVLLLLGGIFFLRPGTPPAPSSTSTSTPLTQVGTTTTSHGKGISLTTTSGHGTITLVTPVLPPSLTGSIYISSSLSPDVQASVRSNEEAIISQLKKDSTRVDLWLQLGVYRKMAGDYAGAAQAWTYVAHAAPSTISYVAYGNLGDLYMNFDKNPTKAEINYNAAIAINPHVIDYYRNLYMLYRYQIHSTAKAAAILSQGLSANPGNHDLLVLQQQLQNGQ